MLLELNSRAKRSWGGKDVKLYRALQVFCNTFNDLNGSLLTVAFTVMLDAAPIVFIFVALTVSNIHFLIFLLFPAISLGCIILILAFLPQHSKVRNLSAELLQQMKRTSDRAAPGWESSDDPHSHRWLVYKKGLWRKQMLAFYPLGIRIWFFGVYTLGTTQELMDQMLNNIILLMSL